MVLQEMGFSPRTHGLIFCSPWQSRSLVDGLAPESYRILSSAEMGLALGLRAVAVRKKDLPKGPPVHSGGGTAKLISYDWTIWAGSPARFEAGTPAVINCIALARALQLRNGGRNPENPFNSGNTGNPEIGSEPRVPEEDPGKDFTGLRGKELLNAFRDTCIGKDLAVPTTNGPAAFLNFDSAASTPAFEPVWEAYRKALYRTEGNELIQAVRSRCARFLGVDPGEFDLHFCANTTEAVNLVASGLTGTTSSEVEPVIVNSLLEHSSNDLPWMTHTPFQTLRLSVDKKGFFDLAGLDRILTEYNHRKLHGKKRVTLVALSGASNVLGTCNDMEAAARIVHAHGGRLLVDGAQWVAHRPVDLTRVGMDAFVLSAHKIYAPFGSGLLVIRKGILPADPPRDGEENLAGLAALGKILDILDRIGMDVVAREEERLGIRMIRGLKSIPGLQLYGPDGAEPEDMDRRVGVFAFNIQNMVSFKVGKELAARNGIGIRVGCHCAHILVKHVLGVGPGLERFQRFIQTLVPGMTFPGMARVSLGLENTEEDVDALLAALRALAADRGKDPRPDPEARTLVKSFPSQRLAEVYRPVSDDRI
ncbi:MAG: aminotransferase class V-fold PLP-dependent enzyme [Bacteroidales bacterium]